MVACKLRNPQNSNDIEDKKDTVAQCRSKPCAGTAKGRNTARTVHEDVVEHNVDRNGRHRDIHGEPCPPVRIDKVSENDRRRNGDEPKGNIGQILHRDIFDHRLKCECPYKIWHGQHTDNEQKHRKNRRPVEALLNDTPNLKCTARTVVLRNHGRQS